MTLEEWKRIAEGATEGPYFVVSDEAEECGPHANSGLSMVDTGRRGDWPVARLCEYPTAAHIAASHPARVIAAVKVIEVAKGLRSYAEGTGAALDFDDALAELEALP